MNTAHVHGRLWLALGAFAVGISGCTAGSHPEVSPTLVHMGWTRGADVTLRQPFAPPGQQNLRLVGASAYLATSADRRTAVLSFHLPGSTDSPRAFVVYWSAPAGDGDFAVPQSVQGFMIQELGELAGKCTFTGGHVTFRKVPLQARRERVEFYFHCDEGTEIAGQAIAQELPYEVQSFERQHAGDIAMLRSPTATPAADAATSEGATTQPDAATSPPLTAPRPTRAAPRKGP